MGLALRRKPKPLDSARELWEAADCIGLDATGPLSAFQIAERDYLHHRAIGELLEAVSDQERRLGDIGAQL